MKPTLSAIIIVIIGLFLLLPGIIPLANADEYQEEVDANKIISLAEGLIERNFLDLAATELENFLEDNPDHSLVPRAMFRLAETREKQNQHEEALEIAQTALNKFEKHPLIPRFQILTAGILAEQGELNEALRKYRHVIAMGDPVLRETALYFSAGIMVEMGELEKAAAIYKQLGTRDIDDPVYYYRPHALLEYASISIKKGKPEEAEKAYSRLYENPAVPDSIRKKAMLELAEHRMKEENYTGAIEIYDKLLDQFPAAESNEKTIENRLRALYGKGDYYRVIEAVENYLKNQPEKENHRIKHLLGQALFAAERFDQSVSVFSSLTEEPNTPDEVRESALFQKTRGCFQLEDYKEVIDAGEKYIERYSENKDQLSLVYYFMALSASRLKNFSDAAAYAEKGIELGTDGDSRLKALRESLAESYQAMDEPAEAAELFRKISETEKGKTKVFYLLKAARSAEQSGKEEAAIQDYKLILNSPEASPEFLHIAVLRLGQLYTKSKKLEEAEKLFSQRLEDHKNGNRPQLKLLLGYIQLEKNQPAKARETLKKLIAEHGDSETVNEAKVLLGEALLKLDLVPEALGIFKEVLNLPDEEQPELPVSLLLELQRIYYRRGDYQTSEVICQNLLDHESPEIRQSAAFHLGETKIALNRLEEAEEILNNLKNEIKKSPEQATSEIAFNEIQILLGEILFTRSELDHAATILQTAFAAGEMREPYATRGRLIMAKIFHKEKRLNQALRQAVSAFVMGESKPHAPRAMLLAIEILIELDQTDEAKTTWDELNSRFPVFADQYRDNENIKQLFQSP